MLAARRVTARPGLPVVPDPLAPAVGVTGAMGAWGPFPWRSFLRGGRSEWRGACWRWSDALQEKCADTRRDLPSAHCCTAGFFLPRDAADGRRAVDGHRRMCALEYAQKQASYAGRDWSQARSAGVHYAAPLTC